MDREMQNPLLDFSGLPRFGEIRPEHIAPAIDKLLRAAEAAIASAETAAPVTWDTLVKPIDDTTERLWRAWGQVGHLKSVVNSAELRAAYNETLAKVTRFSSALGQNLALHAQYKRLIEADEYAQYDSTRKKVIENTLRDFRLGGAELPADRRLRFSAIHEELSALSAKFSENVLDATDEYAFFVEDEADLAGLPADIRDACRDAAQEDGKGGWKLTLQLPVLQAVLTFAESRNLRETLFRASGTRASEYGPPERDNGPIVQRILQLRQELAALFDLPTFADYSLTTKMAESPTEVLAFLRGLAGRGRDQARDEHNELIEFAAREFGISPLEPWDTGFVSERIRQANFRVSTQEVKSYFTAPKVLEGLFRLIEQLFAVKIERDEAPVWHEDVQFFRVIDQESRMIGQFYLDLYARENKSGGAWMSENRNRRLQGSSVQTPLVFLVCNFGRGSGDKPATLTHQEVKTVFHEMGHGLHQLLTQANELGVAGLNGVEWDAVELPSQFMENFCWEWEQVSGMTSHVDKGNSLPRDLFDRMIAAKNFQSGLRILRQVEFALFDMRLHTDFDPACGDVLSLLETVRDEVAVSRPPKWHRFPHAFSHIFAGGYAAGYYSYHWAEVLSADAYAAFEEAPDEVARIGQRFKREILERGGSRDAIENFVAFRGRRPQMDALLRHSGLAA